MKILEICMSKGFGGLELYVMKIAVFLQKNGHNYHVISRKNSFLFNKLSSTNIHSDSLSSVFHHFPIFSAIKLALYINAQKIDVIHVHWGKDLLLVVLAKVFSRRKIRLIYTRHMALTRKKDDFYHRFLYENVDAYLVITKELYNDAVKYLPLEKNKIHLIYHGVPAANNIQNSCDSYIEASGMDENSFRLVIFSRVEKGKGQHLVAEAVKELLAQGKKLQLAIIGHIMDQEYYNSITKYIKHNKLENSVFYLGFHDNPTSIMPCFNAVVLATKCETFGLTLPEAMRAGVAVIGSNCGGVPEIIEHEKTGLLFETENVKDLTKQILKLVDDKDYCDKLAQAGKKDADERFSEEKHSSQLMEVFKSA
jgi:glycosyltransferase involved in cell wall biosynthesis